MEDAGPEPSRAKSLSQRIAAESAALVVDLGMAIDFDLVEDIHVQRAGRDDRRFGRRNIIRCGVVQKSR